MNVPDNHSLVRLESIVYSIPVVGVNVDIRDPRHSGSRFREALRDRNRGIIKYTKSSCSLAPCVMKASDRVEEMIYLPFQDSIQTIERTSHGVQRSFVNSRECRSIAVIDKALSRFGFLLDGIHVC